MTTEEIEAKIEGIRTGAGDYEVAHAMEDELQRDFIRYVATLGIPISSKAKLVLSTDKIDFPRYCA